MSAVLWDLQQADSLINRLHLSSAQAVAHLFNSLSDREPFLFELRGGNNFMLTIGVSVEFGCVQHSRIDGLPRHFMAVSDRSRADNVVNFLAGGTPTPIPARFCSPIKVVEMLAADFVVSGRQSDMVSWEEV